MSINYVRMFEMVKDGNIDGIKESLTEYIRLGLQLNIERKDKNRRTMLHWACYLGHKDIVDWIVRDQRLNLDEQDNEGYSALELAVIRGFAQTPCEQTQLYIVMLLITSGAQISLQSGKRPNCLHWACYIGAKELIIYIFETNFRLFTQVEEMGYYPVDYLFLEAQSRKDRAQIKQIFQQLIQSYFNVLELSQLKAFQRINSYHQIRQHKIDYWEAENEPVIAYDRGKYTKNPQQSVLNVTKVSHQLQIPRKRYEQGSDQEEPEIEQIAVEVHRRSLLKLQWTRKPGKTEHDSLFMQNFMVQQFTIYQNPKSYQNNKDRRLLMRVLYWGAHINDMQIAKRALGYNCSPFVPTYQGQSALHKAASSGSLEVLQLFVCSEYEYVEFQEVSKNSPAKAVKNHHFDKTKCLDLLSEYLPSTALHLAIESEQYHCAKLLIEYGASSQIVNYRNLCPFELSFNERLIKFYQEHVYEYRRDNFYDMGFLYVIQTKGRMRLSEDIVNIQLMNIKEKFERENLDFEFLVMFGQDLDTIQQFQSTNQSKPTYFYYVLKFTPHTLQRLAARFEILSYHLKNKTIQQFDFNEVIYFEFPRDLQIQQMIINTLNEEFDVEKFILEGLVVQHFPLEDPKKLEQMTLFWKQEQHRCIMDAISPNAAQSALRPLHSMSLYYGPVIGWYFAFLVQLVGWLILPSVVGVALGIQFLVTQQIDSPIVPFYALFMALWATFFLESWKRRENELSFSWDMHQFKKREPQRVMYEGQFRVSSITNKQETFDKFTTFQRRLIMDGPVILFGMAAVVGSFLGFLQIANMPEVKQNTVLKVVVGSLNGIVMTVLSTVYKMIVSRVVQWENHRHDSEFQFSYIMKLFLFEFLNSYIVLIYQAVYTRDPAELGINVGSITITRGLIQNVKSNVLPFLVHRFKSRAKKQSFTKLREVYQGDLKHRKSRSQTSKKGSRLFNTDSARENPLITKVDVSRTMPEQRHMVSKSPTIIVPPIANQEQLSETLTYQEQLDILEQLETRNIMQDQKLLIDEYTDLAIQFGYITMFATAFPPGPVFFMFSCYVNLKLSLHNYAHVMKREQAQPSDSIGIWLSIFTIMSYAATLMNCVLIGVTNPMQLDNLIGKGTELRNVTILVVVEHVIFIVKYIIAEVIDDVPGWVARELQRTRLLEEKARYS